ncbi:MAG: transketolase family protein [bacterium]
MRSAFFNVLEELSKKDKEFFILTADLGFKLFNNFRINCNDRFYDIGVAEANMISIAAGLSFCGKLVYCYSIIPFLIMRAYEQIRIDVAYNNLNVKLIGVGGGFTYGLEGFTHFGLEDLTLMRSLPNMTIVVPADPNEAKSLAKVSSEYKGPMYIRLGRTGTPEIYKKIQDIKIGKAVILNEGKHLAIFAIGNMVYIGKQVIDKLAQKGIDATLINMHTLKPLDSKTILEIASTHNVIFSMEEHNINGGLGSAIAEVLIENGYKGLFRRIGIDGLKKIVGNADFLREKHGLTFDEIYKKILNSMRKENYELEA